MPWKEVMDKAVSLGYRSHKTTTCGLHVHVNRTAFGDDETDQDFCISRVLFFVERFWQELLKFSRRNESQIRRWAARYGIKDNPKETFDNAKKNYSGRYTCINLTNYYTIEFRIFRGTLKYNTLIATLQLVNRISYKTYINGHISPYFKNTKLQDLQPDKLQQFINFKTTNGRLDGKTNY